MDANFAVLAGLTGFGHVRMIAYFLEDLVCPGNAAGRSCTDDAIRGRGLVNLEGVIEGGHTVDFTQGDIEPLGDMLHHLAGYESISFLSCEQNLDKSMFLMIESFHHFIDDREPGIITEVDSRILFDVIHFRSILS